MPGEIPRGMREALLETLPLELTALDEGDRIVWWNDMRGARIFGRPARVLGQDVRSCHKEESVAVIDRLLGEMKAGARDAARFWYNEKAAEGHGPRMIVVDYLAVRDARGRYLGCVEALQDVEGLRALMGEKRALD
jgi:DUF438 domain-containing protein